jgi:hypothetical protein
MLVRQSVFGLPRRKQVRDSLRAIIAPRINGHEILPVGSVAPIRCGNRKAAIAGLLEMELAGLEPATSWVRSRRSPI